MITTALESGISYVLDLDDYDKIQKLGNVKIVANSDDADIYLVGINGEGDGSLILSEDLNQSQDLQEAKKAKREGKTVCAYVEITDKNHEQLAVSLGSQLVVDASKIKYDLKVATVTNVKPLGSGDRVCVDTTDMMKPGEGMLIGSYSKSLFLVHSESLESEYVASRPFRVNAGPVQAYVMVPGNKTRYLSELVAGDEVLIVNTEGETRTAYVGRSKIERRPLILIEAEYEGKTIRTLLQNAETIRIVDADNNPLSVADIKIGDKVKVYVESNARHFGIAIDETIIEQ